MARKKPRKAYRVLVGLSYPPDGADDERRAEPGDVVTDLPAWSVDWLLAGGSIAEVDGEAGR